MSARSTRPSRGGAWSWRAGCTRASSETSTRPTHNRQSSVELRGIFPHDISPSGTNLVCVDDIDALSYQDVAEQREKGKKCLRKRGVTIKRENKCVWDGGIMSKLTFSQVVSVSISASTYGRVTGNMPFLQDRESDGATIQACI